MATPEKKKADLPRLVDLDAARAARGEAELEPVILRLGGKDLACNPELPARFAVYASKGELEEAFGELFVDDATIAAFWELKPTVADLEALAQGIADAYGIDLGNFVASATS